MLGKSIRLFCLLFALSSAGVYAQNNFFAIVKDKGNNKPLEGANVYIAGLQKGAATDSSGYVRIDDIPEGTWQITFSFVGYHEEEREFVFPIQEDGLIVVYMEHDEEELDEIVVKSTRGSRTIADEPERVEVIGEEELDEKISMEASNLSMLLYESPGVQVQQVSYRTQATYFRLQGLDGKYTRLLSDGLPAFGGLESGLSLLQVTPLDLQSVEIIKGSTSTLYGGGAIAGVINLISKDPKDDYWSALINRTSVQATDLSLYRSDIIDNFKYYFILNSNFLEPYDVNHDGEAEIPQGAKYNGSVKMDYQVSENFNTGLKYNYMNEVKRGGDFNAAKEQSPIARKNTSNRNSVVLNSTYKTEGGIFRYGAAGTVYRRVMNLLDLTLFEADQRNTFQELTYSTGLGRIESVTGISLQTEDFKEKGNVFSEPPFGYSANLKANYHYITSGIFTQATASLTEQFSLTAGLRGEYNNKYKGFLLPRIALLYKPEKSLALRLSGGLGYKAPEYFTETSEIYLPNSVYPLDFNTLQPEKSMGASFDVNYRGTMRDDIGYQFNILSYYSKISNPIRSYRFPMMHWQYSFRYSNYNGDMISAGLEISLKFDYDDFSLFTGHTVSDNRYISGDNSETVAYNPKHKSYFVLMYELEHFIRLGLEAYYTGRQYDYRGRLMRDYWIFGFMAERHFEYVSVFINFENFTDTRQSRFGIPVEVPSSASDPGYINIFAPLDGFIANAGVKLRF